MTNGTVLNFATSFCFIWTWAHASYRGCPQLAFGCLLCLLTSICYHGSEVIGLKLPFFRMVDMIVCQFCVVYFSCVCASFHWLYVLTITAVLYLLVMFYWLGMSSRDHDGHMWHSTLHFVGNTGISCLIEACYQTVSCNVCTHQ